MINAAADSVLEALALARHVANYAESVGFRNTVGTPRGLNRHLGAILADCVLQAGLNYRTVVKPRVDRIVLLFPEGATLAGTKTVIERSSVGEFLQWKHAEKVDRFTKLCALLEKHKIENASELKVWLKQNGPRQELLEIKGIGPKTVDYLSCLVGIDSIAVDRHIKSFARRAGIDVKNYDALKNVFCCAADLLGSPRRDFDAWVWNYATMELRPNNQYELF